MFCCFRKKYYLKHILFNNAEQYSVILLQQWHCNMLRELRVAICVYMRVVCVNEANELVNIHRVHV